MLTFKTFKEATPENGQAIIVYKSDEMLAESVTYTNVSDWDGKAGHYIDEVEIIGHRLITWLWIDKKEHRTSIWRKAND
jgi:hypothetical protein